MYLLFLLSNNRHLQLPLLAFCYRLRVPWLLNPLLRIVWLVLTATIAQKCYP